MHRPTVLHARVVTSTGGGPDKTIINSPRFLDALGYDCICAFFHPPGDEGFAVLRERAAEASAEIIEIDDRGKIDLSAVRQAIRLCRQRNVDIWHAHDYKTNLIGIIARRFHSMKLITTAHGWVNFAGQTPTYYRLDKRWFLPRYEKVICVSPTVLEECLQAGVPETRCVMIENAIDHVQFKRTSNATTAKQQDFGVPQERILIGSIGRLSDEKGFDLLIDAFTRLVGQGLDAKLVIAGEGPEQASLQKQIEASGIPDRIELLGFCQDTRRFLESLDLFVLSSHREGLPNVVLEAMAVGAPVIATRVGGVPRLLTDYQDGRLIDADSSHQIGDAIRELVDAPAMREQISQAAVKTIRERWSFESRMQKIADLYAELLGNNFRGLARREAAE